MFGLPYVTRTSHAEDYANFCMSSIAHESFVYAIAAMLRERDTL